MNGSFRIASELTFFSITLGIIMTENKFNEKFINVAVFTTSGRVPKDDFVSVQTDQPIEILLHKVAKELGLTDTEGWIARTDDREINPKLSYQENKLFDKVTIDWGPSEGGGGA